MPNDDLNLVPRRPVSKLVLIVVVLGLYIGLCVATCWMTGPGLEDFACRIVNIDTQEQCP